MDIRPGFACQEVKLSFAPPDGAVPAKKAARRTKRTKQSPIQPKDGTATTITMITTTATASNPRFSQKMEQQQQ